jgi:hypothetical protein
MRSRVNLAGGVGLLAAVAIVFALASGCGRKHAVTDSMNDVVIGDINLNDEKFDIGDAVLFVSYFKYGRSVFIVDPRRQILATDMNRDGVPLEVADLQYMVLLITGDAIPYTELLPREVRYSLADGYLDVDEEIAAAFIIWQGEVSPLIIADSMQVKSAYDGTTTRILVNSRNGEFAARGKVAWLGSYSVMPLVQLSVPSGAPTIAVLEETK